MQTGIFIRNIKNNPCQNQTKKNKIKKFGLIDWCLILTLAIFQPHLDLIETLTMTLSPILFKHLPTPG
jgi:hypothetical protein